MNTKISSTVLAKDQYRVFYQTYLNEEAEWLRRGATNKANSIEILLNRNNIRPKTLLEIGCGTGAVISECQHRNLATNYIGVDYAPEAIGYLRKHSYGITILQGDVDDPEFHINDFCDVVIISHVIEHLEEPAKFLVKLRNSINFSHVILEVPLEDLLANKFKSLFRDVTSNKAGHVQFFSDRSFENLLYSNGYRILDRRTYVPILNMETINFISAKDRLTRYQHLLKIFTNNLLPKILGPIWNRFYYAHHAVLCS